MKTKNELLKESFKSQHKELIDFIENSLKQAISNDLCGIIVEDHFSKLDTSERKKFLNYIELLGYRYFVFPSNDKIEINLSDGDDWFSEEALDDYYERVGEPGSEDYL